VRSSLSRGADVLPERWSTPNRLAATRDDGRARTNHCGVPNTEFSGGGLRAKPGLVRCNSLFGGASPMHSAEARQRRHELTQTPAIRISLRSYRSRTAGKPGSASRALNSPAVRDESNAHPPIIRTDRAGAAKRGSQESPRGRAPAVHRRARAVAVHPATQRATNSAHRESAKPSDSLKPDIDPSRPVEQAAQMCSPARPAVLRMKTIWRYVNCQRGFGSFTRIP